LNSRAVSSNEVFAPVADFRFRILTRLQAAKKSDSCFDKAQHGRKNLTLSHITPFPLLSKVSDVFFSKLLELLVRRYGVCLFLRIGLKSNRQIFNCLLERTLALVNCDEN
jgi:hypothetical protein